MQSAKDVRSAMNRTAVVAKEAEAANKEKPKTYFDLQRAKMAEDPQNAYHASAVAAGKVDAKNLFDKAKNPNHPEHDQAMKTLKNDYGMDFGKAEADLINKAVTDMDSQPYEKEDPAFEARIYDEYKPLAGATGEAYHMHNNFKTAVKQLFNTSGYRANTKAIKVLAAKYGLSSNPNIRNGHSVGELGDAANSSLIHNLRTSVRNKR